MSAYTNFTYDFPTRCRRLHEVFEKQAAQRGLEVTLLLSTLTAGFIIPFERLRSSNKDHVANDRVAEHVLKLAQHESKKFLEWIPVGDWKVIPSIPAEYVMHRQPEQWIDTPSRIDLPASATTGSVLSTLRNALAHGVVFVMPNTTGPRHSGIDQIVFVSRIVKNKIFTGNLKVISCTPNDLVVFFDEWVTFLEGLDPNQYAFVDWVLSPSGPTNEYEYVG